jgi:hypothetical protein
MDAISVITRSELMSSGKSRCAATLRGLANDQVLYSSNVGGSDGQGGQDEVHHADLRSPRNYD